MPYCKRKVKRSFPLQIFFLLQTKFLPVCFFSSSAFGFVKNLERAASQQQGEMGHLLEQLRGVKLQAEADKEDLKRATRAQKHRAEHSEDTARQLSTQLLDVVGEGGEKVD